MRSCTIIGAGLSLCLLSGCGPDDPQPPSRSGAPASAASAAPPTAEQEAIRAKVDAPGVRIPPLRTVINRHGREIHGFSIRTRDALAMWEHLRAATERTGVYPLILAADHPGLEAAAEEDPAAILAAAGEFVDAATWFRKQREMMGADIEEHLDRGEWTDEQPSTGFVLLEGLGGGPPQSVTIALLPTTRPWDAAAYMAFGGWNECPNPEVHVAVHRSWHERYGAEPVTMSGDVIEMRIARPPRTREEAEALAMEQFLYASDIVYQGTESLLGLASPLLNGTTWFFWWD